MAVVRHERDEERGIKIIIYVYKVSILLRGMIPVISLSCTLNNDLLVGAEHVPVCDHRQQCIPNLAGNTRNRNPDRLLGWNMNRE